MSHRWVMRFAFGLPLVLAACGGDGKQGPPGADGVDGDNGANGNNGADGANGDNGADGDNGVDGEDGEDGSNGVDGWDAHQGDAPWGIDLQILTVTGSSGANGAFQVGDTPMVEFVILDDAGIPYQPLELYGLWFQLSGPTEHYQVAIDLSELDPKNQSVWNPVTGTWTYTFDVPIPATFHAPPNDTSDLGVDEGDWGGLPLVDGTYTLAASAYVRVTRDDGSTYYDADNETLDVLFGSAASITPRDVVSQENCASCHGSELGLFAHGGSRRDLPLCLSCHVAGAEDRYSATDPSITPGTTISMSTMIHKIHAGAELTNGYQVAGYPADPTGEGYPYYNLHDFSAAEFPVFPNGVSDCDACHAGSPDPNATPSRAACGTCHDAIDWATGANHEGGYQTSDANCPVCHLPSATAIHHDDPRNDPAVDNPGVVVEVVGVHDGTGPDGQLLPGDSITVDYTLADAAGNALTPADLASATAIFSGPLDHMQWILESASGDVALNSVDAGGGTWSYTFAAPVPDVYPAQKNDTPDLGIEAGDWIGLPLVSGTYRVAVDVYRSVVYEDLTTGRVPASDVGSVLLGDAVTLDVRDVVDEDNCLACHSTLEFHGAGRVGIEYCAMCHTAGAEDRNSPIDPASTPSASISLQLMIHRIHMGTGLTQPYEIIGFGNVLHSFNGVSFPRLDGGAGECTACHGASNAWKDPQTAACTSCHDSTDAAAHAAINTHPVYGESCDVCHDSSSALAVDQVHGWQP